MFPIGVWWKGFTVLLGVRRRVYASLILWSEQMNVYIYGPKDDPYHRTPNWRKPYPAREGEELKVLVNRAKENNVIFYWAIHPGQDIRWNEEDRSLLLQKFESMYQLGVRGFAVFFDDISGEGTKADKQAELLNYIDDHL